MGDLIFCEYMLSFEPYLSNNISTVNFHHLLKIQMQHVTNID